MADVLKAWGFVLKNEDWDPPTGKVTPEPNGGKARLGINSIAHPEAVGRGFYEMPLDQALHYAEDCFKYNYWARIFGYNIDSQLIASKWVDMAFNESPGRATKLVQCAVNSLRRAGLPELKVDGECGPLTIAAVNSYDGEDAEALYAAIVQEASTFYTDLQRSHPNRYDLHTLAAWLARAEKRPPA
jgi:lysozyme family protein